MFKDNTKVRLAKAVDLKDLRGIIKPRARGVSIEAMQVAVRKAVAKRDRGATL